MVTISIKVKPNSKVDKVESTPEGMVVVRIKAPPVDGKANAYLVKYLAAVFDLPKSSIEIVQGETSSLKRLRFHCDEDVFHEKLLKFVSDK